MRLIQKSTDAVRVSDAGAIAGHLAAQSYLAALSCKFESAARRTGFDRYSYISRRGKGKQVRQEVADWG